MTLWLSISNYIWGLQALLLSHPWASTRDTQYYAYKGGLTKSKRIALRNLVKQELDLVIQEGEHSSVRLNLLALGWHDDPPHPGYGCESYNGSVSSSPEGLGERKQTNTFARRIGGYSWDETKTGR